MRVLLLTSVVSALILTMNSVVHAGFIFHDVRPKNYIQSGSLDIHVGNLISRFTTRAHEFYFLNWC